MICKFSQRYKPHTGAQKQKNGLIKENLYKTKKYVYGAYNANRCHSIKMVTYTYIKTRLYKRKKITDFITQEGICQFLPFLENYRKNFEHFFIQRYVYNMLYTQLLRKIDLQSKSNFTFFLSSRIAVLTFRSMLLIIYFPCLYKWYNNIIW